MRSPRELDPALEAATLALSSRRAQEHASRLASIELRGTMSTRPSLLARRNMTRRSLAAVGYAAATTLGLGVVVAAWFL